MGYRSAASLLDGEGLPHMPLIRTPATGLIKGVITTHQVVQIYTHHSRGRTVGCAAEHCPDCFTSQPTRYEAYLGFYSPATKKHAILATTLGAVRQIQDQAGRVDRVRGLCLALSRASKRPNSRVIVECGMVYPDTSALPSPPDLIAHLERIWGPERKAEIDTFRRRVEEMTEYDRDQWFRRQRSLNLDGMLKDFKHDYNETTRAIQNGTANVAPELLGFEHDDE